MITSELHRFVLDVMSFPFLESTFFEINLLIFLMCFTFYSYSVLACILSPLIHMSHAHFRVPQRNLFFCLMICRNSLFHRDIFCIFMWWLWCWQHAWFFLHGSTHIGKCHHYPLNHYITPRLLATWLEVHMCFLFKKSR